MSTFTVSEIARACHEANRVVQLLIGEEPSEPWIDCDADLQASAIIGVEKALAGETAEELHDSWCETKLKQGWTYGPVKDAKLQTHPCLVPYDELPHEQRIKDDLFKAVVRAMSGMSL